jgi:hypothetical protein
MGKYIIRDVQQQDYSKIAGIYNGSSTVTVIPWGRF